MKLMFALHGSGLADELRSARCHERLRGAGVGRIQVNLDDEDVAPAQLRLATGTPIGAVVSLWTEADAAPVVDVLTALDPSVHGWLVDERCPIPPPEVAGGRTEALANIAFLRRPEEMTTADWLHCWLEEHTRVAIETQGTFGYVQNRVVDEVVPGSPAVAGIVEELFPMAAMTDLHAFYGSGGDDAELRRRLEVMLASVARFGADRDLDLVPTSRYVFES